MITLDPDTLAQFAVETLRRLVSQESPSRNPLALGEMADMLAVHFAAVGGVVTKVPGPSGDHLVIEWRGESSGDEPHILVLSHLDTALPVGTLKAHPFRRDGDVLSGPGVNDMKGGLVALEMALLRIMEGGRRLRSPFRLVIVNDEEIGSPDGRRVVEQHKVGAVATLRLQPDGLGPDGGGARSPGEHASLRSLIERSILLADYLAPQSRTA